MICSFLIDFVRDGKVQCMRSITTVASLEDQHISLCITGGDDPCLNNSCEWTFVEERSRHCSDGEDTINRMEEIYRV